MTRRAVVRTWRRAYTWSRVSLQPSASEVIEVSRTRTPLPSGRLLLRMPPDLHGALAQAAEREGTSLNGYITARLHESVNGVAGPEENGAQRTAGAQSATVTKLLIANVVTVALAALAAIGILLVALLG
jgi:hypothetical protein